jgi:hypothetical protein
MRRLRGFWAPASLLPGLAVLSAPAILVAACTASPTKTSLLVEEVRSRITPGTLRSEAEHILGELGITYVYVSPETLERHKQPGESVPPGGQIDAVSNHEPDAFVMHFAVFHIKLDANAQVSNVAITEF